jgi:PAS domain S-box-containing protein
MARRGVTRFLESLESDQAVFFDLAPDLLVVLDEEGVVKRVNPAVERALGRNRLELIGRPFAQLVLSEDHLRFVGAFTSARERTFRLLHKENGVVTCRLMVWGSRSGRGYIVMRRVKEE